MDSSWKQRAIVLCELNTILIKRSAPQLSTLIMANTFGENKKICESTVNGLWLGSI